MDLGGFVFQYKNIGTSFTASGFELNADYKFTKHLILKANATYTKVEDALKLRIPELKVNTKLNYQISNTTFMSVSYQFNDGRDDAFFNNTTFESETVRLKSYSIFDFYLSHKIAKHKILFFANVTNILNANYQELYGFSTKGRNINIGFNINL